jgi:hypothetical protein
MLEVEVATGSYFRTQKGIIQSRRREDKNAGMKESTYLDPGNGNRIGKA